MNNFLQYIEMDSTLHRLDPRTKFIFFLVMSVCTSLISNAAALAVVFVFYILLWIQSGIMRHMLTLLNNIKIVMLFIFVVRILIDLFKDGGGVPIFTASFPLFGNTIFMCLEWGDIYLAVVFALRVFLMISTFYIVIITTNFSQIILGLRRWRVPFGLAFGIGLVFQILPMIIGEFSMITQAQSSRGFEVEKCGPLAKAKNYLTVSIPLLFRVIGKGHAISLAMHYYKLDFKKKRTSYKVIRAGLPDVLFLLCTAVTATAVTLFQWVIPIF